MTPAELRALLAKATSGTWKQSRNHVNVDNGWPVASTGDFNGDGDAALIVAAVNALPALLDVAELAAKYMPASDKHKRCNEPDCMRCQLIAAIAKLETP